MMMLCGGQNRMEHEHTPSSFQVFSDDLPVSFLLKWYCEYVIASDRRYCARWNECNSERNVCIICNMSFRLCLGLSMVCT